jgi:hypothetical protein
MRVSKLVLYVLVGAAALGCGKKKTPDQGSAKTAEP